MTSKDNNFQKNVQRAKIMLLVFLISTSAVILFLSFLYTFWDFLVILGLSMFFIGPTYIGNAMMVFTSDKRPIDRGLKFIDGKRLFGKTKTIGGFIGGFIFGFIFSLLFSSIFYWSYPSIYEYATAQIIFLKYVDLTYIDRFLNPLPHMIFIRAFFCALGAPLGDLIGSFVKRRFTIGSGKPFWVLDQLDFIVVTVILNFKWFPLNFYNILVLVTITPAIALFANTIAFSLGRKHEPW
ncbi:MAG: CDP-archaeol synthase [Promethearchaeota archaeon]